MFLALIFAHLRALTQAIKAGRESQIMKVMYMYDSVSLPPPPLPRGDGACKHNDRAGGGLDNVPLGCSVQCPDYRSLRGYTSVRTRGENLSSPSTRPPALGINGPSVRAIAYLWIACWHKARRRGQHADTHTAQRYAICSSGRALTGQIIWFYTSIWKAHV